MTRPISDLLRLRPGQVDLDDYKPRATTGYPGKGKRDQPGLMEDLAVVLDDRQERLFAAGRVEPKSAPRVLLVLQGMDTSGKGGVIRHVARHLDPQGLRITGFGPPTANERRHDFLWRIRRALPAPGQVGIFDRSHYEDVLVPRVTKAMTKTALRPRYAQINAFEAELAAAGTIIIKCFLHVSLAEQRDRLLARLDNPAKHWKYSPSDLAARRQWPAYTEAYTEALRRCHTETAPWYVIPADRKWYRNWAVAQLLTEHLQDMDLSWPEADYDVAEQRAMLEETATS